MRRYRTFLEQNSERRLRARNQALARAVEDYRLRLGAGSLRLNWLKYEALYRCIRAKKPREVLELGAGMSTVVIAYALRENERESPRSDAPRVTSMEESLYYHARTVAAFPGELKKYAEILASPKVEDCYQLFRGVRYKDVPVRPYDMVFIDGPTTGAPSDGHKTFDFDFLNVVIRSEKPVYGIVDLRLSSMWVYEQVLGREKVRFDYRRGLGFVYPVTRRDMRVTGDIVARHSFRPVL